MLTREGNQVFMLGKKINMGRFNEEETRALLRAVDDFSLAQSAFATPVSELLSGVETFHDRNKTYGDSYLRFGAFAAALFPNGITIRTLEDWNAFGVLVQMISKMIRLCEGWDRPTAKPTVDSNHDLMVYSAILKECQAFRGKRNSTTETNDVATDTTP